MFCAVVFGEVDFCLHVCVGNSMSYVSGVSKGCIEPCILKAIIK